MNNMNKINSDIFHIILGFLKPTDISRSFRINKFSNNSCVLFVKKILKEYNSESLIDMTCPKCGDWVINDENYKKDKGFKDILGYLVDDEKECFVRLEYVGLWFKTLYAENIERRRLLCFDCECYEEEPYDYPIFKYKANKDFKILTIYDDIYNKNWSLIYYIVDNTAYWNDYLKISL